DVLADPALDLGNHGAAEQSRGLEPHPAIVDGRDFIGAFRTAYAGAAERGSALEVARAVKNPRGEARALLLVPPRLVLGDKIRPGTARREQGRNQRQQHENGTETHDARNVRALGLTNGECRYGSERAGWGSRSSPGCMRPPPSHTLLAGYPQYPQRIGAVAENPCTSQLGVCYNPTCPAI